MKALTVRQPWAWLIVAGIKTIETRSWKLPASMVGQRIAIHAGAHQLTSAEVDAINDAWDAAGVDLFLGPPDRIWRYSGHEWADGDAMCRGLASDPTPMPLGAIVGYVTLGEDLPIVDLDDPDIGHEPHILARGRHADAMLICRPGEGRYGGGSISGKFFEWQTEDISDQRPYGDYTPGRHGWTLLDPEPCDPIPRKGRLGFWPLDGAA